MAARHSYNDPPSCHYLSRMNDKCQHCGALHWKAEHLSKSTCQCVYFGSCCNSGKVKLPLLSPPPRDLRGLYCGMDQQSCEFHQNILQYNSALAFTSLGVQQDDVLRYLRSNVNFNQLQRRVPSVKVVLKFKFKFVQRLLKFRSPSVLALTQV
ncbi:transcriptional factor b3 [Moniliophthora roreri MCA 2997]|uniref:Transcriptional factor b3 n=1 Tax=Moniliophthora roreri (strain MCA 2997) TaxID=1381753 RepID=V2W7X2_MONRO|nr:transcriptional factor b3 [Moniliophthora roreri MCA 2997]